MFIYHHHFNNVQRSMCVVHSIGNRSKKYKEKKLKQKILIRNEKEEKAF